METKEKVGFDLNLETRNPNSELAILNQTLSQEEIKKKIDELKLRQTKLSIEINLYSQEGVLKSLYENDVLAWKTELTEIEKDLAKYREMLKPNQTNNNELSIAAVEEAPTHLLNNPRIKKIALAFVSGAASVTIALSAFNAFSSSKSKIDQPVNDPSIVSNDDTYTMTEISNRVHTQEEINEIMMSSFYYYANGLEPFAYKWFNPEESVYIYEMESLLAQIKNAIDTENVEEYKSLTEKFASNMIEFNGLNQESSNLTLKDPLAYKWINQVLYPASAALTAGRTVAMIVIETKTPADILQDSLNLKSNSITSYEVIDLDNLPFEPNQKMPIETSKFALDNNVYVPNELIDSNTKALMDEGNRRL